MKVEHGGSGAVRLVVFVACLTAWCASSAPAQTTSAPPVFENPLNVPDITKVLPSATDPKERAQSGGGSVGGWCAASLITPHVTGWGTSDPGAGAGRRPA